MKKDQVLLVDDEPRLVRLVQTVLHTAGFEVVVSHSGAHAVEMAALEQPSVVVLDLLLPGDIDGYEVCRRVRQFSDVPIIMLTAKASEEDKLKGFEAGADDYMTKPFSSKELLARVKAVLKRSKLTSPIGPSAMLNCGDISIDLVQRKVTVRGKNVALTPTEYDLLRLFTQNAGRVMLYEDILRQTWGPEYRDETEYLRDYVRFLRRKIEADPAHPQRILTMRGVGYLLSTD